MNAARGHATRHWRNQKISALALVVLGGWFLFSLLSLSDPGFGSVRAWLAVPAQALLMLLFSWCALWHSAQGVQVVVDDYVYGAWHARARLVSRSLHLAAAAAVAWALYVLAGMPPP
ncbi:MAG: succinate dehydrogenase, hydrophobic membrane anchor protein [Steroidobacteraceae bacterium]|nr:succinate dehydrogenase, hydrophobic membrane anchor protein [Steroidobacteraceae bacterium]